MDAEIVELDEGLPRLLFRVKGLYIGLKCLFRILISSALISCIFYPHYIHVYNNIYQSVNPSHQMIFRSRQLLIIFWQNGIKHKSPRLLSKYVEAALQRKRADHTYSITKGVTRLSAWRVTHIYIYIRVTRSPSFSTHTQTFAQQCIQLSGPPRNIRDCSRGRLCSSSGDDV